MSQRLVCRAGAVEGLAEIVSELGSARILLVTGKGSYARSGARSAISNTLRSYELTHFSDFDENPKLEHVLRGVEVFHRARPDVVVAVGGGTAMDMAKMVCLFAAQAHPALDYVISRRTPEDKAVPLIAIPTTAGSGSQATHFAAVYVNKTKFSVAHASILPDVAIVDPNFLISLPRSVAASAGMDALSQAIESFWSIHATEVSRSKASEAISTAWRHLAPMVNHSDEENRLAMARAAHLAGEAINITKTTAPHAISYPITSYFGVRHGHAVGLILPMILLFNTGVGESDCLHPAGPDGVRKLLRELSTLMGAKNFVDTADRYSARMNKIGLCPDLRRVGIKTPADVETIVTNGFNPQRVNNNPRRLTAEALRTMLNEAILRKDRSW